MMLAAIILAAGASSRMGRSKQMLLIDGHHLLNRTIDTILRAGIKNVAVVIGAEEKAHRKLLEPLPVNVVYNADWQKGMGSSLKAGLHSLTSQKSPPDAVVVSVCDQPLLSAENISNLLKKYEQTGKPIVASRYSGKPGVPALFDHRWFKKLEALGDAQGAKTLMLSNLSEVAFVDFQAGEVDLDTMEDYQRFLDGMESGQ